MRIVGVKRTRRPIPAPQDDDERRVCQDVVNHYCHVVCVESGDTPSEPKFQYSVGLTYNFDLPEIITVGQKHDWGHAMVNVIRDRVRSGEAFVAGQRINGLIPPNYDAMLVAIDKRHYPELFGYCLWFYCGDDFAAFQLVWPDKENRFPWDTGCSRRVLDCQPVFDRGPGTEWRFRDR